MEVKFASIQDAKGMIKILQEHLIDIDDPKIAETQKNGGFLIRNVTQDQMEKIILDKQNSLALVAKENDETIGYLASSRFNTIPQDLYTNTLPFLFSKQITDLENVIFHRQIAAKSGTKNAGNSLMEKFLEEAKMSGYHYVVCRIIHAPIYNQKSISFHERFGFELIGIAEEKNLKAGVYLRDLTS